MHDFMLVVAVLSGIFGIVTFAISLDPIQPPGLDRPALFLMAIAAVAGVISLVVPS